MKCLVVLTALMAIASAGLAPITYSGLPLAYNTLGAYSPYGAYPYATVAASPYVRSVVAPALTSTVVSAPAPAILAHSAVAAPAVVAAPTVVAAPIATGVKTQYHAQDELGQASYGHSEPLQAHSAVQDAAGNKVGSFSYVSPDGQVLRTDYVADGLGYRVASNALPVGPGPVAETPEVVAARAAHLAVHARARRDLVAVGHTPAATSPLVAAPLIASPIAYHAPYAAPVAYHAPLAYSQVAAVPSVLSRPATLTTVVNNPGHAVSYRVD